tara:strand:+ start:1729 stop:3207 length:1479 start_codon:yes stop_codon:yes gene_type:complete
MISSFKNGKRITKLLENRTTISVISPVNNKKVSEFIKCNEQDVNDLIQDSYNAYKSGIWANDSRFRSKILRNIGKLLEKNLDRLAMMETEQIGRPLREMKLQLSRLSEWFEYYSSLIRVHEDSVKPFNGNYLNYVKRVPLGVVCQITPWNHPLLITIKKLAPALAAGNSVIVKPSELAPNSIIELAQICKDAGLPDNIFNVVLGDGETGSYLIKNELISKIDFTGGPKTGRIIGKVAGENLCGYIAELGGKSPMIVFNDVDIDNVVNGTLFGTFIASGQTCIAGTRILVDESILDNFINKFVKKVKNLRLGDPFDEKTHLGPVITANQLDYIDKIVNKSIKEGGRLFCGGKRYEKLKDGNYYEPTVIMGEHTNIIFHEEVFGPVVAICSFKTKEEAIKLANSTKYGLGCSIWTNNLSIAHTVAQKIDSGIIWINDHHKNDPSSPWGGLTKESGIGRENGIDSYYEYTQTKSIIVNCDEYKSDWFGDITTRYS